MLYRIERDELGKLNIPESAYYGIKTLRNKEAFIVSKLKVHKQMIKSLAIVKKSCALANFTANDLTEEQKDAILNACDEVINGRFNNQFITDAIQGGSCIAFNLNMDEVIANRANEILGGKLGEYKYIDPYSHVDLFQSPNDVIPTAAKHALLCLVKPLFVEYRKLIKAFNDKAKAYKGVYKIGRDHLQDSLPVSFKDIFDAFARSIKRDYERVEASLNDLKVINLGTGTLGVAYYQADAYVDSIVNYFNELTQMDFISPINNVDTARNLDSFANLSQALKLSALNLSKIINDIRLMASGPKNGFNELNLPSYEKVSGLNVINHTQSVTEIVNQVCFQIIGKDLTVSLAVEHGQQEVNAFSSIIYANLFDSIEYLTKSLAIFREYCLKGLTVNVEYCQKSIISSFGAVVGLLKVFDYQKCVEIFLKAKSSNKTIKEICLEEKLLSEEKFDKILEKFEVKDKNK